MEAALEIVSHAPERWTATTRWARARPVRAVSTVAKPAGSLKDLAVPPTTVATSPRRNQNRGRMGEGEGTHSVLNATFIVDARCVPNVSLRGACRPGVVRGRLCPTTRNPAALFPPRLFSSHVGPSRARQNCLMTAPREAKLSSSRGRSQQLARRANRGANRRRGGRSRVPPPSFAFAFTSRATSPLSRWMDYNHDRAVPIHPPPRPPPPPPARRRLAVYTRAPLASPPRATLRSASRPPPRITTPPPPRGT